MKPKETPLSKNVTLFTIEAPQLDAVKKIWVYLPHNYNSNDEPLPVVYMHDGQVLFDRDSPYTGEQCADEVLDELQQPLIVVGIEHGEEKRNEELTPFTNEKYGGGNGDAYLEFIADTLMPYINNNFRVRTGPENTFIMGKSLGALISYYAVLKYPQVFGKIVAFSPSFWFNDAIYALTEQATAIKAKIYFMAGTNEGKAMVPDMQRIAEILKPKLQNENDIYIKVVKGGKHNDKLWGRELKDVVLWLVKD